MSKYLGHKNYPDVLGMEYENIQNISVTRKSCDKDEVVSIETKDGTVKTSNLNEVTLNFWVTNPKFIFVEEQPPKELLHILNTTPSPTTHVVLSKKECFVEFFHNLIEYKFNKIKSLKKNVIELYYKGEN